jgi:hypothetical protein
MRHSEQWFSEEGIITHKLIKRDSVVEPAIQYFNKKAGVTSFFFVFIFLFYYYYYHIIVVLGAHCDIYESDYKIS